MISQFTKIFLVTLFCLAGSFADAEVVNKFSADYTVTENGEVQVIETITYDFAGDDRHGIYRTIEHKHPQGASAWYKKRTIDLEVQNVEREGESEPYTIDNSGGDTTIKIGDADEYITGIQTYTISYVLSGVLSYGTEGAEFYYNATGNDWEVPILLAVASVHGEAVSGKYHCYQGGRGSTETCTNSLKDTDAVVFTANNINAGEGLTIATEIDASKVSYVVHEQTTWLLFGFLLAGLWGIFLVVYVYRFRRSNYSYKTVVAQYEPYKDYLPMYTGYLVDNQLDAKDITAGILYLAEQGFIKITKTTKKVLLIIPVHDYEITLVRTLAEIPTKFLTKVSELLFASSATVGSVVLLSSLAKEQSKNITRIMELRRDLAADLQTNGFLESTFSQVVKKVPLALLILALVFGGFSFVQNGVFLIIMVFVATVLAGLLLMIPRKTATWYEAKNHIEGFKLFLTVMDKERFDFHNAPEKSPELFMQYLPYAVALGVEEKWAKVFAGITIPNPVWYDGGSVAAFSASALTNDLGAFSTALSSNSGVSGSSGGGSSGGGGGGGGGGSW